MMSGRVLFCSQSARFGESEFWLDDISRALREGGWEVVVALARGRFHEPSLYLDRHPHPNVLEIDGSFGLREQRFLNLLGLFERVQPDVIVPLGLADALYAAVEWKRLGGKARLCACFLSDEDERMVGDVRACEKFVDLVVAATSRLTGILRDTLQLDAERIVHIPLGVPPPSHPPHERDHVQQIALIAQPDQLYQRAFDLIPVAQLLEGEGLTFHIVVMGKDEGELRSRVANEVRRGAFFFYGSLPRAERYERIYPQADALLSFCEREPGPTLLEAMIHGVVPIVADYQGRKDESVIRDGDTGYIFPIGAVETAAGAVRRLCRGGALTRMSRRTRELLPKAYRQAEFHHRWNEQLAGALTREMRSDSSAYVPRPVSPGLLARFGLGPLGTLRLRRLFRRRGNPHDADAEWPRHYVAFEHL